MQEGFLDNLFQKNKNPLITLSQSGSYWNHLHQASISEGLIGFLSASLLPRVPFRRRRLGAEEEDVRRRREEF